MVLVFLNGHKMEQKVPLRYESIQICLSANSGSLILLSVRLMYNREAAEVGSSRLVQW